MARDPPDAPSGVAIIRFASLSRLAVAKAVPGREIGADRAAGALLPTGAERTLLPIRWPPIGRVYALAACPPIVSVRVNEETLPNCRLQREPERYSTCHDAFGLTGCHFGSIDAVFFVYFTFLILA